MDINNFLGIDTVKKEVYVKELSMESKTPRDPSTRAKFIKVQNLEAIFGEVESHKLQPIINSLDVGHIQELEHGGDNSFENLFFEGKDENREPGKKRQIERESDEMLISGKKVTNKNTLWFDPRIPIRVPCFFSIEEDISFKNGRPYKTYTYQMSNEPYLKIVTSPATRNVLLKADFKNGATEMSTVFLRAGFFKAAVEKEDGFQKVKTALKTAGKVVAPYAVKTCIKLVLDTAQTSPNLSNNVRKKCASVAINPTFNATLNVTTHISSDIILIKEIHDSDKKHKEC